MCILKNAIIQIDVASPKILIDILNCVSITIPNILSIKNICSNSNEEIAIFKLIEERKNNLNIFLKSAWYAVTNTEDIELPVLESFIRLISTPDIIYQMDPDILNVRPTYTNF